jgi:hypothetical protein
MNKEQLRELVKAHFNLVDTPAKETFGEIFDENKAFKIVFPGDELKVGDEVKVVTAEGQESLAPDGFHKLIDGTVIKTEGSSVVSIEKPDGTREEKMSEEDGLGILEDKANKAVEAAFAADDAISEVQGTTPQNAVTKTDIPATELEAGPEKTAAEVEAESMAKIKMAVDEAVASAITGIKEEMAKMKEKFEEFAKAPATAKTMAATSATKSEKFTTATNDSHMKIMRELIKTKNK